MAERVSNYSKSFVPIALLVLQLSAVNFNDLTKRLDLDTVLLSQGQHKRIELTLESTHTRVA